MPVQIEHFDAQERALEKARSRSCDQRAVALGQKSDAELKRENEVFAPLGAGARIDLSASHSFG